MKAGFAAMIGLAALVMVGCQEESVTGPVRDVPYYVENTQARKQILDMCEKNPGELEQDPNCVNARKAQMKTLFSSDNEGMPSFK